MVVKTWDFAQQAVRERSIIKIGSIYIHQYNRSLPNHTKIIKYLPFLSEMVENGKMYPLIYEDCNTSGFGVKSQSGRPDYNVDFLAYGGL